MKKAFKMIFIYLGVLLLALIATVVFCAAFLFFYREGNIFGFKYVSADQVIQVREDDDMSELERIEIYGEDFPINIGVNPNVSKVTGAMRLKAYGFTHKSWTQVRFVLDYNYSTKTATFRIDEPEGWLNTKDSYIEIAIPEDLASSGFDLTVKTVKGDVTVRDELDFNINKLNTTTKKGDITIGNVTLNDKLITSVGSGSIYIDSSCETSTNIDASVSVGSGVVNFAKINAEKFSFGCVEVVANKRGKIGILKAEEVKTNQNVPAGGEIQIGTVGFIDFTGLDIDVKIINITKITESRIRITGHGSIWVGTANCDLEIDGNNGNVTIGTATGILDLKTNQGDIVVDNAVAYVSAVTVYGNIKVNYDDNAGDYDETNKFRAVFATTKNGHIIVNGLQKGTITATGKGRISLKYNRVVGDNIISAQSGAVNVIVPHASTDSTTNEFAFNLIINTEVSSDIKVGLAGYIGREDPNKSTTMSGSFSYTGIYATGSTDNNLDITSTTGKIKVRSLDLVNH